MSKIINGGLDQYGPEPFKQQQFGAAGVERVNDDIACASTVRAFKSGSIRSISVIC